MSDPALELRPALRDWLKADTEVVAAFGSSAVKVFAALPTVNAGMPYVVIAGMFVEDRLADCYDAATVSLQMDVWSLTTPASFTEAERIAQAVKASLTRAASGNSPALTLASHTVKFVENSATQYLTDPSDLKTVHAVIQSRLTIDPT